MDVVAEAEVKLQLDVPEAEDVWLDKDVVIQEPVTVTDKVKGMLGLVKLGKYRAYTNYFYNTCNADRK